MCIFRTLFAGDTFSRLENYGENHHSQSIESTFVAKKHCSWPKCSVNVKFINKFIKKKQGFLQLRPPHLFWAPDGTGWTFDSLAGKERRAGETVSRMSLLVIIAAIV